LAKDQTEESTIENCSARLAAGFLDCAQLRLSCCDVVRNALAGLEIPCRAHHLKGRSDHGMVAWAPGAGRPASIVEGSHQGTGGRVPKELIAFMIFLSVATR